MLNNIVRIIYEATLTPHYDYEHACVFIILPGVLRCTWWKWMSGSVLNVKYLPTCIFFPELQYTCEDVKPTTVCLGECVCVCVHCLSVCVHL